MQFTNLRVKISNNNSTTDQFEWSTDNFTRVYVNVFQGLSDIEEDHELAPDLLERLMPRTEDFEENMTADINLYKDILLRKVEVRKMLFLSFYVRRAWSLHGSPVTGFN